MKMKDRVTLMIYLLGLLNICGEVYSVPTIVQSFSSRYGLVMGGYGPSYKELQSTEAISHAGICSNVLSDLPSQQSRFLGDVSGLAEYSDLGVIFCRHTECSILDLKANKWRQTDSLKYERSQASSVEIGGTMVVVGGTTDNSDPTGALEVFDTEKEKWVLRKDLRLSEPRHSFCAVPVNETTVMVLGGWGGSGSIDSTEFINLATGGHAMGQPMPEPSYGHACLVTEINGQSGVLVTGGALTGQRTRFLSLKTQKWSILPKLLFRTDGHKMILIEGVPTLFSWENIQKFDGEKWYMSDQRLPHSRSAFTVTSVPGHLVDARCQWE
jgi:hypothetical protein